MAGNRIDIMEIRDLIRLKQQGFSNRKVAQLLNVSRNTVNGYVRFIEEQSLDIEQLMRKNPAELLELFPAESEVDSQRYQDLAQYFSYFERELKKRGCTQQRLWQEYYQKHPDGYMRSQFNYHLSVWRNKTKVSYKLTHKVAEKLYIDFAGKKLSFIDKQTGELIYVNVFVAVLPASGYTFVFATLTQGTEDVVEALKRCLIFLGGVPLAIVPDCMKTIVTKSHKHAPVITATFRDLAHHYNCVIDPARPYSPQDKALVENAVNLVYQRIYYPLSKHTFFSLEDINKEISAQLVSFNKHRFSQSDSNREQEFLSMEKEFLQPLPDSEYQLRYFNRITVHKMAHIYLSKDKHYYSVPYRLVGKLVTVAYSSTTVEIFYKQERVALHKRDTYPGKYTTNPDHLMSTHKAYSEWSLEFFQYQAKMIGPATFQYITELILQRNYPEIGYKQAYGIIQLAKSYTPQRVELACERAMGKATHRYQLIANILKKNLDKEQMQSNNLPCVTSHANIRGAQTYQ